MTQPLAARILIVAETPTVLARLAHILGAARARGPDWLIDQASLGEEALAMVESALAADRPYDLAFVDLCASPAEDGLETLRKLWRVDARLQVAISCAVGEPEWEALDATPGASGSLLLLRQPFDRAEVLQAAATLCEKARLSRAEIEGRDHAFQLELANAALKEANAASQASARAKNEFLANMSHEIRTPMTAILGFAELLLDATISLEERQGHLHTIRKNGQHLLAIINDILDLSKIEAGRLAIEKKPVSPFEMLSELASTMRVRAREKGLGFEVRFESELPELVQCDPTRLRQILINLVGNAIKFTSQGSVEVIARMAPPGAGGEKLVSLVIQDTGIGIPPEKLPALFKPFSQVDASMTRQYGGTGLGLALSRRLAIMLGGDITVQSSPGHGSSFCVTFAPGALEGVAMIRGTTEALKPQRSATSAGGALPDLSGRILLAEDGRDNQRLIAFLLRKAGAEVAIVDNGRLACEHVQAAEAQGKPFDLLLLDMQMPELDGYGAAQHLRARGCKVPIIALTAHAMSDDRDKCLQAGCDDYTTKPVDRRKLIELCARWLVPAALPAPDAARHPTRDGA